MRRLMLVESPNKVQSIKQLLKNTEYADMTVMASVGHFTRIANVGKHNLGIDVDGDFSISYEIEDSKKDIVRKLKEQVRIADVVYLASDPDREGEAIAWTLKKFLNIPDSKYKRITYHEITKSAILKALENPRRIDEGLVKAAQTRQRLDKIVGFELSPIARVEVGAKSVGRCQSPGLKLIVDREREIRDFKPVEYYDLYLDFKKEGQAFKAKYSGFDGKVVKQIKDIKDIKKIKDDCSNGEYLVGSVESKKTLESPKPAFCTSTFQQEVSKRLGIGVTDAMSCAQKLFEGINVGAKHVALITYHRSDSTDMSPEFVSALKGFVESKYGERYWSGAKKAKKSELAQEGHEAIRPVDLDMTPKKLKEYIDDPKLIKTYEIIYNRAVASVMSPTEYGDTSYVMRNGKHEFSMKSRELLFEGWKSAYSYKSDEDDETAECKTTFKQGEKLKDCALRDEKKSTTPPKRYTEASFIAQLDKLGIGRPSTYATIVGIVLDKDRGYCQTEKKELVPTERGEKLISFLEKNFKDIVDYGYTAELEKSLDEISDSKLKDLAFMKKFYSELEGEIKKVVPETKKCPECGSDLVLRKGKYGKFWGCSNYPKCKHIENIR